MSAKCKIAGQNWEFDGSTITVHIPMTFKRRRAQGHHRALTVATPGRRRSRGRTRS